MRTEPCPFCRMRIVPEKIDNVIKRCPACGNYWIEDERGRGVRTGFDYPGSGGGVAVAIAR